MAKRACNSEKDLCDTLAKMRKSADGGETSKRFVEQWYGLVFGFRNSDNENTLPQDKPEDWLDVNNNGWFECHQSLNAGARMISKIADVLNKTENCLVTTHDGRYDSSCNYNGLHWHAMVKHRCHPTRDSRWGRFCLDIAKQNGSSMFFACEQVISVPALAKHILTQPRKLLQSKGIEIEQYVSSAGAEGYPAVLPGEAAKVKADKNYHRIQYLMKLMEFHRTSDINTIKGKIIHDAISWDTYMATVAQGNFDVICKKAVELYRTTQCHMTLEQRFRDPDNSWRDSPKLLSLKESRDLFDKWLQNNNFDKSEFCGDLFNVLERKVPKLNTFCLQGPPNAGKSFILRSIVAWYQFFGEVRGGSNYNFLWQDCIDTGLIFIEEPYITPDIVEQMKLVLEGAPTQVHIKMRGDATLKPTPVFITCNNLPWKWVGGEENALRARMYFRTCKRADFLKDVTKYINPLMWAELYWQWREPSQSLDKPISTVEETAFTDDDYDDEEIAAIAAATENSNTTLPGMNEVTVTSTPTNSVEIIEPSAPSRRRIQTKRVDFNASSDTIDLNAAFTCDCPAKQLHFMSKMNHICDLNCGNQLGCY